MATHFSILAWRIPGTEEPSGLPSMGWHRIGHDWSDLAAAAAAAGKFPAEGNGKLLQYACLKISMDKGAWWTTMGYRPWGCKESDTTEQIQTRAFNVEESGSPTCCSASHPCNPDGTERTHAGPCQRTSETTGLTSPTLWKQLLKTFCEHAFTHTHTHTLSHTFPKEIVSTLSKNSSSGLGRGI